MQSIPAVYKEIGHNKSLFYTWFEALHTRIDIILCHLPEQDCQVLSDKIRKELLRIEKSMNRFDPESELSLINRRAASAPTDISEELAGVIADCLRYREVTSGYFDITIHSRQPEIETPVLLHSSGSKKSTQISFTHPDISIDLGGYAKGYALDRCRLLLETAGCKDALLSFGNSSVLAIGNHPAGEGWKVSPAGQTGEESTLHNECLTTSGNENGKLHIVSPRTGKAVPGNRILSVKTKKGTEGEALSTALFAALGDETEQNTEIRNILERFELEVGYAVTVKEYT